VPLIWASTLSSLNLHRCTNPKMCVPQGSYFADIVGPAFVAIESFLHVLLSFY